MSANERRPPLIAIIDTRRADVSSPYSLTFHPQNICSLVPTTSQITDPRKVHDTQVFKVQKNNPLQRQVRISHRNKDLLSPQIKTYHKSAQCAPPVFPPTPPLVSLFKFFLEKLTPPVRKTPLSKPLFPSSQRNAMREKKNSKKKSLINNIFSLQIQLSLPFPPPKTSPRAPKPILRHHGPDAARNRAQRPAQTLLDHPLQLVLLLQEKTPRFNDDDDDQKTQQQQQQQQSDSQHVQTAGENGRGRRAGGEE